MKALGLGWGSGIRFRDIEVERGLAGAPSIKLHNHARRLADARHIARIAVSLTHDRTHATAMVIAEDAQTSARISP